MCAENCIAIRARSQTPTHVTNTCANRALLARTIAVEQDTDTGREQPPGPSSGQDKRQNWGVAHAPAPSVTSAKCVSRAAQNAALVVGGLF
jgi:hypothetical protein